MTDAKVHTNTKPVLLCKNCGHEERHHNRLGNKCMLGFLDMPDVFCSCSGFEPTDSVGLRDLKEALTNKYFLAKYREQKVENEKAIIDNYNKRLLSDAAKNAQDIEDRKLMKEGVFGWEARDRLMKAAIKSAKEKVKG